MHTATPAPVVFNNRRIILAGTHSAIPLIENNSAQPLTINTDVLFTGGGSKLLTLGGNGGAGATGDGAGGAGRERALSRRDRLSKVVPALRPLRGGVINKDGRVGPGRPEMKQDATRRARRTRPRRLVLLLDVSGSMSGYARAMLRFAVAARGTAGHHRPVEVFAFGTRLTRLTDALSRRDPDAALTAAAAEVVDWDGGTRIGDSVTRLVRDWARGGTLRGAVVVVCSDGLERGDPRHLGEAMARLRRHVHRIVWCNPLAGDPRYEPTQRGMRAALPYVDVFLPGHDLASLEDLAAALTALR